MHVHLEHPDGTTVPVKLHLGLKAVVSIVSTVVLFASMWFGTVAAIPTHVDAHEMDEAIESAFIAHSETPHKGSAAVEDMDELRDAVRRIELGLVEAGVMKAPPLEASGK